MAGKTQLVETTTDRFEKDVIESDVPVIIDFWAPWCGPCRAVGPLLAALSEQWAGKVKVVKLNVDDEPAIAQAFRIRSIPTIVAMRGRDVVDVQIGAGGRKTLEKLFAKVAEAAPAPEIQAPAAAAELN